MTFTVMADCLRRAGVTARAIVLTARLNVNGNVSADDVLTDLFFYVVSDVMGFFNRKVFADGQVKVDHLL